MERGRKKNDKPAKGSLMEWYRVYETRMAINLLEPWEKWLANSLMIIILLLISLCLFWLAKLLLRVVLL